MITSTNGNAWLTTTHPDAARASRVRRRAMTYAVGVAIATAIAAELSAAARELNAACSSGCSSKAWRKLARVGSFGIQVGCRLPSSRGGLNATESSHRNGKTRKAR